MSKGSAPLTIRPESGTPYRLDPDQTLRAATALAKAIERSKQELEKKKPSLLAEESDGLDEQTPLWLVVSAKKHLTDNHKLKPGKIAIPHSLWTSPDTRVCLITADPPSANRKVYKNLIQHRLFPEDLKPRIARVIAYSKLKTKYKSYESLRQLVAEYDLFLADDRIINLLPNTLGKTFYRSTAKRPIPVSLTGKAKYHGQGRESGDGKLKRKRDKESGGPETVGQPFDVGADIQKSLDSTVVHLGPSISASVRIAWSGWPVELVAENIGATVEGLVAKYVPKGWRGIKSLHIKSNHSIAIPIWLSAEVWTDDQDVLNQDAPFIEDGFNKPKKSDLAIRLKAEREKKASSIKESESRTPAIKPESESGTPAMKSEMGSKTLPIKPESESRTPAIKSEGDEAHQAKKRKTRDREPLDDEAVARKRAKKEKKERKEKEAAALKLKESTMRKEDLEIQKRAAKREAQAIADAFKSSKPKKEKKQKPEAVSELASKKGAVEPVSD